MATVKRTYDASRRQERAHEHRLRILECARERFLRDGYASTTIAQVASDAGVASQTVTRHFANKPGLVRALFDVALVGDTQSTPLAERPWIVAIHDEPDPARKLSMYARALATMVPRTAPIQLLVREASADPALAAVWRQIRDGRRHGLAAFAANLAEGGHLAQGVTLDHATDVLWTYSSPELYELLVLDRRWTLDQYAGFIETGSRAALLGSER